jgi:mannose-6-phosphate isomerase-like protein (cupin superfamily)
MQSKRLKFGSGFRVAAGDRHSQAAQMTLAPSETEGGPGNCHRGSDQWLYVVSGSGQAIINGRRRALQSGTLLLIQRGEYHEIRNTGKHPLRTLNVYVPPAYDTDGDPLPRGK